MYRGLWAERKTQGYPCDLCWREKPAFEASWIRTSESGWNTWPKRWWCVCLTAYTSV